MCCSAIGEITDDDISSSGGRRVGSLVAAVQRHSLTVPK
jgi:hypothetical protein